MDVGLTKGGRASVGAATGAGDRAEVPRSGVRSRARAPAGATHEVIIVGTGFAGLAMAHAVKARGANFVVLEKASDVGGCWRDNTYPGCACDIPSHLYSFSFDRRPDWTRMYPQQQEIWAYLRSVADRFDLRRHIRFDTPFRDARWDEAASLWEVEAGGETLRAPFLVTGLGPLNIVARPDIPGIGSFRGHSFHSAEWDHAYPLAGRRVGVIGTGASSIQFVPRIQPQVGTLTLFQRTAPWVIPRLDRRMSGAEKRLMRRVPGMMAAYRGIIYALHEARAFGFLMPRLKLMAGMELLGRLHMRRHVKDPVTRAKLTPDYAFGCKRVLVSDDYYPALARENVEVVTDRIAEIRPDGVVTADGRLHALDTIIYGTGFAVANPAMSLNVVGRDGARLADTWNRAFEAYKGTTVHGFPNLFVLVGPNTGLGHNSMVYMIESQVAFVLDAIDRMEREGVASIEVRADVQARHNDEIQRKSRDTVWTSGCASWYVDARGRNAALWPGFSLSFRRAVKRVRLADVRIGRRGSPA